MLSRMRVIGIPSVLLFLVILLVAVEETDGWWGGGSSRSSSSSSSSRSTWKKAKDYVSGVKNGAKAMDKAYNDMKEANWKNSDKYFHARGNADAAKYGTGGRHAARVISDAREAYGFFKGDSSADRAADQRANEHGRNGGDPNKYRPKGLPKKYKK